MIKSNSMPFNLSAISHIEFCVTIESEEDTKYFQIPVSPEVKTALIEMLLATRNSLGLADDSTGLEQFELSQKYSAEEKLQASLAQPHFAAVQNLFGLTNIPVNPSAVRDPKNLTFYFVSFYDSDGNKLLAVRRAAQFKGILKAQSRIVALIDDTLILDARPLFRLDNDFDYFVLGATIYILRPSGLEYTAAVGEQIMNAVAATVSSIGATVPFIKFSHFEQYVRTHRSAARLIAALRTRNDLAQMTKSKVVGQCRHCKVRLIEENGQLIPAEGHELAFLQVLDRRRYTSSLVPRKTEYYEAPNRRSVAA